MNLRSVQPCRVRLPPNVDGRPRHSQGIRQVRQPMHLLAGGIRPDQKQRTRSLVPQRRRRRRCRTKHQARVHRLQPCHLISPLRCAPDVSHAHRVLCGHPCLGQVERFHPCEQDAPFSLEQCFYTIVEANKLWRMRLREVLDWFTTFTKLSAAWSRKRQAASGTQSHADHR